jgi:hypothetical protein
VYRVATGRGLADANVYLVRSVLGWVLIDTAWPHRGRLITAAAESVFGAGGEPTMMRLGFFRRSVELAELYRRPGQITDTIQTNGSLFDDDWGAFFAEHGFWSACRSTARPGSTTPTGSTRAARAASAR